MHRFIYFVFLLLTTCFAFSQNTIEFHLNRFTTDEGLPSNGIKGLQWDEESGFLWIATEAGISRFNGLEFKNFTKDNTPFIGSERILFIVRNYFGKIYSADQSGNIITINKNRLALFGKYKPPPNNYFGNLFTIVVSDTLFRNPKEYKGQHPFSLLGNYIMPQADTGCYILYNGNIFRYSNQMERAIRYTDTSLFARAGFKLDDQFFIVGKDFRFHQIHDDPSLNKIFRLQNEDGSPFTGYDKQARLLWANQMKNPIILNGRNAWRLSLSGGNLVASLLCDEIPTDVLIEYAQYSETKQLLFLGTNSKGIIVVSRNRLQPMKSNRYGVNERNAYYSQVELPDGNILTGEGHIIGQATASSAPPIKGKFGYFTAVDRDSNLWYSQSTARFPYNHLNKYHYKSGKTTEFPGIRGTEFIVKELSNGKRLVTSEFGISFFTGDSLGYIYRHPAINYDNAIYDFIEIKPGVVLIAGCAGILQFDTGTKKLDTVMKATGHCFRTLWRYKDYIFWGTYGQGFFIWKNGILKSMPLDKKKYLLYTHCFMPDEMGYCWISTNRGLFKASITELINAYEKNTGMVYYHYFGKNDGMDMIEMNGGCNPCALQLRNKNISFPTMDGLLWVNPSRAEPVLPDGQLFIDEIVADDKYIDPEQKEMIVLPAKTNDIIIRLSFAGWCNRENIYVDYQLNDSLNWRSLNTDNDATLRFSNLSTGEYTLRFRKLNGFGINNYSYKTISFRIITPWHKTWWFTLLVLLVLAGLVFLYVHLRTSQLKKNQQRLERLVAAKTKELQEQNEVLEKNNSIKTRLISIISHDIVTPLKFLTVAGKNLIEKRKQMPDELQVETIKEITNTSQELQLLSTNILNWIKYQNENRRLTKETFNMHEMVRQVLGILNSLAQQKNLRIVNAIAEHEEIHQFYEPMKILVYNLLTNAINFSEKGTITVSMKTENGRVTVSVKDEGTGMTPEKIQSLMADHVVISSANVDNKRGHGLGFLIIKDLLKTVGATLHIDSKLGEGSTISIVIAQDIKEK